MKVQLFLAIFVFFEGNLISADQTCKKVVDLRNAVDKIAKEVEQTCCKSCHRGSEGLYLLKIIISRWLISN